MALLDKLVLKVDETDPDNKGKESTIFYRKMQGDYYRYILEIFPDEADMTEDQKKKRGEYVEKVKGAYKMATESAEASLPETHPTRLGLALNYSVCFYEILGEKEKACDIAKQAFDNAIEKLDTLNDASYKDSTLIMQLLRDNLTIWQGSKDDPQ